MALPIQNLSKFEVTQRSCHLLSKIEMIETRAIWQVFACDSNACHRLHWFPLSKCLFPATHVTPNSSPATDSNRMKASGFSRITCTSPGSKHGSNGAVKRSTPCHGEALSGCWPMTLSVPAPVIPWQKRHSFCHLSLVDFLSLPLLCSSAIKICGSICCARFHENVWICQNMSQL